jgi:hypothetical protein
MEGARRRSHSLEFQRAPVPSPRWSDSAGRAWTGWRDTWAVQQVVHLLLLLRSSVLPYVSNVPRIRRISDSPTSNHREYYDTTYMGHMPAMVPGIEPAVPAVVMLIPTLGPWWWRGRSTASSLWKTGVALGVTSLVCTVHCP